MNALTLKAFVGLLQFLVFLWAVLFMSAGTFDYWQAWVFLGEFAIITTAITLYLVIRDPELLARRIKAGASAEQRFGQKVIQAAAKIAFLAQIALPGIDRRFGWSSVPLYACIAGAVVVAFGLYFVFRVFRENTFASATIEVRASQRVISTGPYAWVRHPMYIGALIMLAGVPPALGSWWGLLALIPMTLLIVWRLLDEEKFLLQSLPGYAEYREKVRWRLVPWIW